MAELHDVMAGIAQTIGDATELRCYDYVPDTANPPFLFLTLGAPIERGAFKMGQMELRVDAVMFVSSASDRAGQHSAYDFASWGNIQSVWNAVDDNNDFGLGDTNGAVLRYRPLGIEEIAAYNYYGGVFELLVLTAGST